MFSDLRPLWRQPLIMVRACHTLPHLSENSGVHDMYLILGVSIQTIHPSKLNTIAGRGRFAPVDSIALRKYNVTLPRGSCDNGVCPERGAPSDLQSDSSKTNYLFGSVGLSVRA